MDFKRILKDLHGILK